MAATDPSSAQGHHPSHRQSSRSRAVQIHTQACWHACHPGTESVTKPEGDRTPGDPETWDPSGPSLHSRLPHEGHRTRPRSLKPRRAGGGAGSNTRATPCNLQRRRFGGVYRGHLVRTPCPSFTTSIPAAPPDEGAEARRGRRTTHKRGACHPNPVFSSRTAGQEGDSVVPGEHRVPCKRSRLIFR